MVRLIFITFLGVYIVNFGGFNPDEGDVSGKRGGYFHDAPRTILLFVTLFSAICGGFYSNYANKPLNVIDRSLKKTGNKQFRASVESSTTIGDSVISDFKSHQRYIPGRGLVTPSGSPLSGEGMEHDSLSAFRIFSHTTFIREQKRQDMYGNPTRHFTGSFRLPDDGDSTVHAFEYWINMRNLLPVRLVITTVVRNVAVDDENEPISRITYTNIGYSDWRE